MRSIPIVSLLLLLTGACASAPPPPPVEPDPGRPIVVQTAEQATSTEAERLRLQADAFRADSDAMVARRAAEEREKREASIRREREMLAARRTGPSGPGYWNPSKGEKPSPSVSPPPYRRCRTVAATETQGLVYTVRQADGSRTVEAEPVPVGVLPLEICDRVAK